MNADLWLAGPLAERWTLVLLHFLWQGAAVATLLLVALTLVRWSARGRYLASVAALVLMALCPLATFGLLPHATTPAAALASGLPVAAASTAPLSPGRVAPTAGGAVEEVGRLAELRELLKASAVELAHWDKLTGRELLQVAQPWLLVVWLGGAGLLSLRLAAGLLGMLRLAASGEPVAPEWEARLAALGRKLGLRRLPRLCVSNRVSEATVLGFLRPLVLLPAVWLTELPCDAVEAVLAHELAHLRRWDLWVNLGQRIVETLLFFHPAVWWVSRRIRVEREMCCDELAVAVTGRRREYAEALELVARQKCAGPRPAFAAGIGDDQMALLERVRNVLGLVGAKRASRAWLAGLVSLVVLAGAALASLSTSEHEVTAWIQVDRAPTSSAQYIDPRESDEFRQRQLEAVKSDQVLLSALRAEGGALSDSELLRGVDHKVRWLKDHVKVGFSGESDAMFLSLKGQDPRQQAKAVNAIAKAYLAEVAKGHESSQAEFTALKAQLRHTLKSIQTQKDRLHELAKSGGASDPEAAAAREQIALHQLAAQQTSKNLVEDKLRRAKANVRKLTLYRSAALDGAKRESSVAAHIDADPVVQALNGDLLQAKRDDSQGERVEALTRELDQLKAQLRSGIEKRFALDSIDPELRVATADVEALESELEEIEKGFDKQAEEVAKIRSHNADLETARNQLEPVQKMADELSQRLSAIDAKDQAAASRIRLIQLAKADDEGDAEDDEEDGDQAEATEADDDVAAELRAAREELEAERQALRAELEALRAAHRQELEALRAEIEQLRAGRDSESNDEADDHEDESADEERNAEEASSEDADAEREAAAEAAAAEREANEEIAAAEREAAEELAAAEREAAEEAEEAAREEAEERREAEEEEVEQRREAEVEERAAAEEAEREARESAEEAEQEQRAAAEEAEQAAREAQEEAEEQQREAEQEAKEAAAEAQEEAAKAAAEAKEEANEESDDDASDENDEAAIDIKIDIPDADLDELKRDVPVLSEIKHLGRLFRRAGSANPDAEEGHLGQLADLVGEAVVVAHEVAGQIDPRLQAEVEQARRAAQDALAEAHKHAQQGLAAAQRATARALSEAQKQVGAGDAEAQAQMLKALEQAQVEIERATREAERATRAALDEAKRGRGDAENAKRAAERQKRKAEADAERKKREKEAKGKEARSQDDNVNERELVEVKKHLAETIARAQREAEEASLAAKQEAARAIAEAEKQLNQTREGDFVRRYHEKAAAHAQAEFDKAMEANKQTANAVAEVDIARFKLAAQKTQLAAQLAEVDAKIKAAQNDSTLKADLERASAELAKRLVDTNAGQAKVELDRALQANRSVEGAVSEQRIKELQLAAEKAALAAQQAQIDVAAQLEKVAADAKKAAAEQVERARAEAEKAAAAAQMQAKQAIDAARHEARTAIEEARNQAQKAAQAAREEAKLARDQEQQAKAEKQRAAKEAKAKEDQAEKEKDQEARAKQEKAKDEKAKDEKAKDEKARDEKVKAAKDGKAPEPRIVRKELKARRDIERKAARAHRMRELIEELDALDGDDGALNRLLELVGRQDHDSAEARAADRDDLARREAQLRAAFDEKVKVLEARERELREKLRDAQQKAEKKFQEKVKERDASDQGKESDSKPEKAAG